MCEKIQSNLVSGYWIGLSGPWFVHSQVVTEVYDIRFLGGNPAYHHREARLHKTVVWMCTRLNVC